MGLDYTANPAQRDAMVRRARDVRQLIVAGPVRLHPGVESASSAASPSIRPAPMATSASGHGLGRRRRRKISMPRAASTIRSLDIDIAIRGVDGQRQQGRCVLRRPQYPHRRSGVQRCRAANGVLAPGGAAARRRLGGSHARSVRLPHAAGAAAALILLPLAVVRAVSANAPGMCRCCASANPARRAVASAQSRARCLPCRRLGNKHGRPTLLWDDP